MTPEFDVLSYGTIGLDYVLQVPHWPSPDISTHAPAETEYLGGKATNTAAALSVWGIKTAVCGHTIGDDAIGDRLFEHLAQFPNLSTGYLARKVGLMSMYCRILVNADGERAIIGVNVENNPQTPVTAAMIESVRLLTLDLYGGAERVETARLASEAGRPVVVGDLRRADHPVLPYTSVAIASAAEVRKEYAGLEMAVFAEMVQAAGPKLVIVTDGADDVRVFDAGGEAIAITPPAVTVVDTTGAGDAFRAGVVYGVLAGWRLVEAAALGAAAGALNVTQWGAASSPSPYEDVKTLAQTLRRRIIHS